MNIFERVQVEQLRVRLAEKARLLTIVAGPRQVGKTTLVRSVLDNQGSTQYVATDSDESRAEFSPASGDTLPSTGTPKNETWLVDQWQQARQRAQQATAGFVFAVDEIQKIPRWSEVVKGLHDADRAVGLDLRVVLLGSSPLLMRKGLTESLAGRFETIPLSHWTFPEMHDAFGLTLDEYLYFGGYPGSAKYIRDEARWRTYVRDSLIEPAIGKDIFQMERVDRQPLFRELFRLGCNYSGQVLALNKMAPHLEEDGKKGHTNTLAHYVDLLAQAGLLVGLQKYAGSKLRLRGSPPKFIALNNALMSVESGDDFATATHDRTQWGRVVETAVGAHLYNSLTAECQLFYWSAGSEEVDFVLVKGRHITAIEVKSGRKRAHMRGFDAFEKAHGKCQRLIVGEGGVSLPEFFSYPADHWV